MALSPARPRAGAMARSRHQAPTVIPFASKGFGSYWPKLCFCMATSCPCAHRKFAGALAVFVAAEGELVQTEGGARSSRDETPQVSVGTYCPFGALAYLEMCDLKGLRVVCVPNETNGMQAGDVVAFGGDLTSRNKIYAPKPSHTDQ